MTTYIGGFFDTLCRRLMGGGFFLPFSKKKSQIFKKRFYFSGLYATIELESKEALMKSARAGSERFCSQARFEKGRNTVCTRKGYAASVSQLALATAALYFKLFKPPNWRKRSAEARRHNCAVLP